MLRLMLPAFLALAAAMPSPAAAQWLTPFLESQRYNNLRNHQLRTHRPSARHSRPMALAPRVTLAQRQAAWARHKAGYRRQLMLGGQARADRWLDQQVLAGR